jgi:membrane protein
MAKATRAPGLRQLVEVVDRSFLKELFGTMGSLNLQTFAAGIAYGAVFALVPMIVLLVLVLGAFGAQDMADRAIAELADVLPADATSLVEEQVHSAIRSTGSTTVGIGALVSVGIALWGASGAMRTVIGALNVVHRVERGRSFVANAVTSVLLAIGAIVAIVVTIAVIVLGDDVAHTAFGIVGIGGAADAWNVLRWPLLVLIAWIAVASAYRFAPATRICGGFATPGTVVATLGWVGFSVAFSWYAGNIATLSATWGSVASVIVLLLYLQYTALIVLLGALVDVVLYDRGHRVEGLRAFVHRIADR